MWEMLKVSEYILFWLYVLFQNDQFFNIILLGLTTVTSFCHGVQHILCYMDV